MRILLCGGILWAACIPAFAADVQLLLVRNAVADLTCDSPVFRGRVFAVPASLKLDTLGSTLGLTLLARVEELPYEDNAPEASSIPVGTYPARIRVDPTKRWMKAKPSRAWRLELDTPRIGDVHRTAIQFHYGPDKSWSQGCVILTGAAPSAPLVCNQSDSPDEAVKALRGYVESTMVKSDDKVMVRIVEWPDREQ